MTWNALTTGCLSIQDGLSRQATVEWNLIPQPTTPRLVANANANALITNALITGGGGSRSFDACTSTAGAWMWVLDVGSDMVDVDLVGVTRDRTSPPPLWSVSPRSRSPVLVSVPVLLRNSGRLQAIVEAALGSAQRRVHGDFEVTLRPARSTPAKGLTPAKEFENPPRWAGAGNPDACGTRLEGHSHRCFALGASASAASDGLGYTTRRPAASGTCRFV